MRLGVERGMGQDDASRTLLLFLSIGSISFRLPFAALADRVGRRRAWLLLMLLQAGLYFLCAAAPFNDMAVPAMTTPRRGCRWSSRWGSFKRSRRVAKVPRTNDG